MRNEGPAKGPGQKKCAFSLRSPKKVQTSPIHHHSTTTSFQTTTNPPKSAKMPREVGDIKQVCSSGKSLNHGVQWDPIGRIATKSAVQMLTLFLFLSSSRSAGVRMRPVSSPRQRPDTRATTKGRRNGRHLREGTLSNTPQTPGSRRARRPA